MNALIALEGQIGAGKTTLGLKLSERLKLPFHAELSSDHTNRMLERFYSDRSRWAFTMQAHFIVRRAAMLQSLPAAEGGILDRSLAGDRVFAEVLHEEGFLGDEEFFTYRELFDILSRTVRRPDLMIFLECSVDVALERIRRRNRTAEAGIPRTYIAHIDRRYREWFSSYDSSPKLAIPVDAFPIADPAALDALVNRIEAALEQESVRNG
ncbi:MAG TPA: deoxynucleoside kinase [Spirochaetia bacterium]|nr:deoxynucleoside kinase [Spirochaetia bacterium]